MKKLTVEYLGYKLEVEVEQRNPHCYPTITGTCNSLSFNTKDTYGNYHYIVKDFIKAVDKEESGMHFEIG